MSLETSAVRASALLAGLAVVLCGGRAYAQTESKAASVLAYDEAERLMGEGKLADACPKYAESQRLDPQLGTLLHLADCLEQSGKTASAWAAFRDAAELAEKRGDGRLELARGRAAALVPRLSKLQIEVPKDVDTPSLEVRRDDVVVGSTLWGTPVPTDPGLHVISVTAPGREAWTGRAMVATDGSTSVIKVPKLASDRAVAPAPGPPSSTAPAEPAASPSDRQQSLLARHWPALIAGGVGLIGVGVGTGFGLKSKSKRDAANEVCDGRVCDPDKGGLRLKDEAIAAGNVSTVAFIVGGVGLAAGTVLWLTAPSSSRDSTSAGAFRVGFGPAAVSLERSW